MTNAPFELLDGGFKPSYAEPVVEPFRPSWLSDISAIIDDVKNGRICVLIDDDDPHGEAVLFVPAQMATPKAITFMACHARGLICLALTPERVEALGLERMPQGERARPEVAFTVSIEARTGVTTGISAFDRARTVAVAISTVDAINELVSPGHVFPLVAQSGGVLSHGGHTEAVVDLSRLAGLNPSGVFCVLLNEDGDIARAGDLTPLVEDHGLKIGSIRDLIRFRLLHDRNVVPVKSMARTDSLGGHWDSKVYRHCISGAEALVLLKGGPRTGKVPLCIEYRTSYDRMIGRGIDTSRSLAMSRLKRPGSIVILLDRKFSEEEMPSFDEAATAYQEDETSRSRQHALCAQILADLGVMDVDLLEGSTVTRSDLEKFGISFGKRIEH